MTVRSRFVVDSGGLMPSPEGDETVAESKETKETPVAKVQRELSEGMALRAFATGAGLPLGEVSSQHGAEKSSTSLNIGDVFKAQAEQNTALIGKLSEVLMAKPQGSEESKYVTYLVDQVKGMQTRMENQPDPLTAVMQGQQQMQTFMAGIKEQLGLPPGGPAPALPQGPTDAQLNYSLQLQQLQVQMANDSRRWELMLKGMDRRFELEDRRFALTHNLEVQKFTAEQGNRQGAGAFMGHMVGAFTDGIEAKMNAAKGARAPEAPVAPETPAPAAASEPPTSPTAPATEQFRCDECEGLVYQHPTEPVGVCHTCEKVFPVVVDSSGV